MDRLNKILLPTASSARLEEAADVLQDRSPLWDADTNALYMKWNGELHQIVAKGALTVDGYNIVKDENSVVSLNPNIRVKTNTVTPLDGAVSFNDYIHIGSSNKDNNHIHLFCKESKEMSGFVSGEIFEYSPNVQSNYRFSIATNGQNTILGSSTFEEPGNIVRVVDYKDVYYGIMLPSDSDTELFFHGINTIPFELKADNILLNWSDPNLRIDIISSSSAIDGGSTGKPGIVMTVNMQSKISSTFEGAFSTSGFMYMDNLRKDETDPALKKAYDWRSLAGGWGQGKVGGKIWTWSTFGKQIHFVSPANTMLMERRGASSTSLSLWCNLKDYLEFTLNPRERVLINSHSLDWAETLKFIISTDDGIVLRETAPVGGTNVEVPPFSWINTSEQAITVRVAATSNYTLDSMYFETAEKSFEESVDRLPATGELGNPHTIKVIGDANATNLSDLGTKLRKQSVQIILDCSKMNLDASITEWTYASFEKASSLRKVILPSGINSISTGLFKGCLSLQNVTLPSTLTSLSGSATEGLLAFTSVDSISIPSSVTQIGVNLVKDSQLSEIYLEHEHWAAELANLFGTDSLAWGNGNYRIYAHQSFIDEAKAAKASWQNTGWVDPLTPDIFLPY